MRLLALYLRPSPKQNKVQWIEEKKRNLASSKIKPLVFGIAVAALLYFAISSLIMYGVVTESELASRTLRQKFANIPSVDLNNNHHTITGKMTEKIHQSIFTLPQVVMYPPPIRLDNIAWEPDYNGLYLDSFEISELGKMIDSNAVDNDSEYGKENQADECHTPTWTKMKFPICNVIHETVIDSSHDLYLGYVGIDRKKEFRCFVSHQLIFVVLHFI